MNLNPYGPQFPQPGHGGAEGSGAEAMPAPAQATTQDNPQLMAALALAWVRSPGASLHELAAAAGISKATLYRFAPTKEQIQNKLMQHALRTMNVVSTSPQVQSGPPIEALRWLTEFVIAQREMALFLMSSGQQLNPDAVLRVEWTRLLDALFLRGQKAGVFRVDVPAAALSEIWGGIVTGLLAAEHCGRVARMGMAEMMEATFLKGAGAGDGPR